MSSLTAVDYADRFALATDVEATPEKWARAMFGDTPRPGAVLIWRGFLGIRLSRGPSADTVAGWRIGERGDGWIRLEAASWFLSCNLVVRAGDGEVSLETLLHYDRPFGHVVWPPLSAVHRRLAPGLLSKAAARLTNGQ